jgi:hypothetical protein
MDYHKKYLKYKRKFLNLIKKGGGDNENLDFFLNFNNKYIDIINKYEKFNNFNLINIPIKKLGKKSKNGVVNLINFSNTTYTNNFSTVLKTSLEKEADNNYYEYVVGNCINRFKQYYPNFVYTFNYMNFEKSFRDIFIKADEFNNLKNFIDNTKTKLINVNELQTSSNIGEGCLNNDKASVLIEYIPNSLSFDDIARKTKFTNNLNNEIFNILFQVYGTLFALRKNYTHYDLHLQNVMFFEVPNNKKMQIIYNLNGTIFKIYTYFIPVIIDYGRSYVDCLKIDDSIYSKVFTEIACSNELCNNNEQPKCNSKESGLVIEKNENDIYSKQENFHYINLRNKNESFDLRYLHNIMNNVDEIEIKTDYLKYLNNDWFTIDPKTGKKMKDKNFYPIIRFGVKENENNFKNRLITTISDCFQWLTMFHKKINVGDISNLYGTININLNFEAREIWKFTPKN